MDVDELSKIREETRLREQEEVDAQSQKASQDSTGSVKKNRRSVSRSIVSEAGEMRIMRKSWPKLKLVTHY